MRTGMWKRAAVLAALFAMAVTGCGGSTTAEQKTAELKAEPAAHAAQEKKESGATDLKKAKLKITTGDKVLYAALEDNATTRAFVQKLPTTLSMENLYAREMCYHYGGSLRHGATATRWETSSTGRRAAALSSFTGKTASSSSACRSGTRMMT
ncbi:hypothetical protein TAMA11512_23560 [Selenomonas sp. TAMA-11512]|uniref:cyclophilin-like fold protein n=1 Tax=Selenomonas sp. TAMA-11512 TaxID=3095337 RepID=UPI00308D9EAA|nr:hypothetical protein TAMA11512_23560 [Selenomonas sp. TAMA-11512]